jgi:ABC-type transport system substrate-binding protein
MPGFEDRDVFALDGSPLEEARSLLGGRTETAVMAVWADCEPCMQEAEVVRANLSRIGITVEIEELSDPLAEARKPGADIDLLGMGTGLDYGDPAGFLERMFLQDIPHSWLAEGVAEQIERLSRLGGAERRSAAVQLADELATTEVPVAATVSAVVPALIGPRLGCRVFPPMGFGIDLAELCLEPVT